MLLLHAVMRLWCNVDLSRRVVRVPGGSWVPEVGFPVRPKISILILKGQEFIFGRLVVYGGRLWVPVQDGVSGCCLKVQGSVTQPLQ